MSKWVPLILNSGIGRKLYAIRLHLKNDPHNRSSADVNFSCTDKQKLAQWRLG